MFVVTITDEDGSHVFDTIKVVEEKIIWKDISDVILSNFMCADGADETAS